MTQISTHDVSGLRVTGLHFLDSGTVSLTIRTVHQGDCEREPVDVVLFFTDGISAKAYRDAIGDANKRIECERAHAEAVAEKLAEDERVGA